MRTEYIRIRNRINEQIRAQQVRLLDETGAMIGIKSIQEALDIAREKGLDLVEISPEANPPVCKIIGFSKFKYIQEQKLKEQKKKQRTYQTKEIRLRPSINVHDLDFKLNHAKEFLVKGQKVKFTIMFLGREMTHQEFGRELVNKIRDFLKEVSVMDSYPKMEGNRLVFFFSPNKK